MPSELSVINVMTVKETMRAARLQRPGRTRAAGFCHPEHPGTACPSTGCPQPLHSTASVRMGCSRKPKPRQPHTGGWSGDS